MRYERPEILKIGEAKKVTLGFRDREISDGCDCTKDKDNVEVA